MLKLKKLFHFKHYIVSHSTIKYIFNWALLYKINNIAFSPFPLFIYIKFIFKSLKKKILSYIFSIKLFNSSILNSKVLNFWMLFSRFKTLALNFKFNPIKIKNTRYTILRSPHVHKTSREQFFFSLIHSIIKINFINSSSILKHYWEYLLKKKISKFFSSKLIVKRIFN